MGSFRTKTVILSVAFSSLLPIITGLVAWNWIHNQLRSSIEEKVTTPGQRLATLCGLDTDWEGFSETLEWIFSDNAQEERIIKIRSNLGDRKTLYQSDTWLTDFPFQDLPDFDSYKDQMRVSPETEDGNPFMRFTSLGEPHVYGSNTRGRQWRLATFTNSEITIYLGINPERDVDEIRNLRVIYFGALIVVILGIAIGGHRIASQAIKPVEVIANTAKRITSRDLDERIPTSSQYDTEFHVLVEVINDMMDRLETSFKQAMRFTFDASHELKTPLANIQNEISSRLQNLEPHSTEHQTLDRLHEEVQRLKQIIRSLFLLSQADAGAMPLTIETYNLSRQVESLAQDGEILAEMEGLTAEAFIEPDLFINGDQLMLGQAIRNLINNAIKYNSSNGFVKLTLRSNESDAILLIENPGAAIDPVDQAHIFDRFYRGRSKQSSDPAGLGLGLSLAKEIITAHGGKLTLVRSDSTATIFELILQKTNL